MYSSIITSISLNFHPRSKFWYVFLKNNVKYDDDVIGGELKIINIFER